MFRSNEETFYLTWDLVSWSIGGRVVPWDDATEELLAGLKVGDFAIITPPPSKADQFDQVWGALPMYIPFHSKDRNAASTLGKLARAVGSVNRSKGKAVFVDGGLQPLKATDMTNALHRALCSLMSADRARLFSWHSARIYLASALGAMKVKPSVIQAMLRWQTEESLRLYNRMSMVGCG
jgi:hypothetical protein